MENQYWVKMANGMMTGALAYVGMAKLRPAEAERYTRLAEVLMKDAKAICNALMAGTIDNSKRPIIPT